MYVADGKLSEDSTDAVNGSQLHATNTRVDVLDTQVSTNTQSINQLTTDVANNTTNITNLSDTVGKGWSIASKGNAEAQKVAMGDTVEFTNKDGNIAVKHDGLSVSFDLAEELKLTSLTVGDKVTITNTGINAGDTVITNVANGNVAENSKDAVNGGQLFETNTRIDELSGSMSTLDGLAVKYDSDAKDKVTLGNPEKAVTLTNVAAGKLSEDSTDAVNGGQVFDVKTELSGEIAQVGDKVTQVAGNVTQLTNRITVNEADIVNLKAADALTVKYDGDAKDKISLSGAEGTLLTNLKGGEIAKGSTDAVTGGQMFDMQERFKQNLLDVSGISQGLDFAADSGKFNRKLGETIRVVGSNNITTQANNGTITVSMADNPVFKGQVQAQGGLVVQDHLAVAPGSIIDAGGNPISNIGPGTKPGDAVNVQQLAEVQQQLGGQIGQIHSELDRATKDARGGTAAAMAMALSLIHI